MHRIFLLLTVLAVLPLPARAWWENTHAEVVTGAVALLPGPLRTFFDSYGQELAAHAGDSDKLRHKQKHANDWFDLEGVSTYPFTDIPANRAAADSLYGKDKLEKDLGVLPWNAANEYRQMVDRFRHNAPAAAVRTAVHLAHHIADAHMPLHTTLNFDGKPLGHKGVHARMESACEKGLARLPRAGNLKPALPGEPFGYIMDIVRKSNGRVFPLLYNDAVAHDKGLVPEAAAEQGQAAYEAFMLEKLGPLFGMCLDEATAAAAGLWLAAWTEAGQPALPDTALPITWEVDEKGVTDE